MSSDIEAQLVSIRHELLLATITGNRVNLRIRELLRREHDLQAKLNSQLVDAILAPSTGTTTTYREATPMPKKEVRDPGKKRWRFMDGFHIGVEGDPYLDRLNIIATPMFGIYLHRIHRADHERDGHDHPWWFASLVLCGSYEEQIWPDKTSPRWERRNRKRWSVATTPLRQAHRIDSIDGTLWTLCLVGPRRHSWGFYPGNKFVPWADYMDDAYQANYRRQAYRA